MEMGGGIFKNLQSGAPFYPVLQGICYLCTEHFP